MFQQTHPLGCWKRSGVHCHLIDFPIQPVISVLGACTFGRYHTTTYEDKICIQQTRYVPDTDNFTYLNSPPIFFRGSRLNALLSAPHSSGQVSPKPNAQNRPP